MKSKRISFLLGGFLLFISFAALAQKAANPLDQRVPEGEPYVYVNFAVNCHDWLDPDMSAAAILKAARIFEANGFKGDFYFTEPLAKAYKEQQPQAVAELNRMKMPIGYHHRPPHPLWYTNWPITERIRAMDWDGAYKELMNFETHELDVRTGEYIPDKVGGYEGVAQAFGRKPVVLGGGAAGPFLNSVDRAILKNLGARMAVEYHSGGEADYPLMWYQGILARPSDFSVSRIPLPPEEAERIAPTLNRPVQRGEEAGKFWWDAVMDPNATYTPANFLRERIADSPSGKITFVTVLIHEDNWYKAGTAWDATYYEDKRRTTPKKPPFTIDSRTGIRMRSPEEVAKIWERYEEIAVFCAKNPAIRVVTCEDILNMVQDDRERDVEKAKIISIAEKITNEEKFPLRFVVLENDAFSLADAFQALTYALAEYERSGALPEKVHIRDALGPTQVLEKTTARESKKPAAKPGPEISARDVIAAASAAAKSLKADGPAGGSALPSAVSVGKELKMNTAEMIYAMAQVVQQISSGEKPGNVKTLNVDLAGSSLSRASTDWTIKPARRKV